jgi:hypothetical protein
MAIIVLVQNSHEGTLAVCDSYDDGLPGGIITRVCVVNMGAIVPIRVLNVKFEKKPFFLMRL